MKIIRFYRVHVGLLLGLVSLQHGIAAQPSRSMTPSASMTAAQGRFPVTKFNTVLGIQVFEGSALLIGGQFAILVAKSIPLYLGPDLSFALYPEGHVLSAFGGGWMDIPLSQRLVLTSGVVGGPAFSEKLDRADPLAPAAFLDLALAQEVDDLVSVRGQFRPGLIGSYFAFTLSFNISFRFY